jgi:phospholipase/lecithinase/hemolysin
MALKGMLQSLESAPGVQVVRLDVFTILEEVVANPAAVGLMNVVDPCIRLDTKTNAFCPRPNQYLFWDGIHPTVAGHRILARRAHAALDAVHEAVH